MSQRGFVVMALRLLGIYALIQMFSLSQGFVYYIYGTSRQDWQSLIPLVSLVATFGFGIVLLVYADRLAARLGYGSEPMGLGTKTGLSGRELQAIGFSLVGVLILVRVTTHLAGMLSNILVVFSPPSGLAGQWDRIITNSLLGGIAFVLQLGLGIGLFFGGRWLADWWHDRYAPPEELAGEAGK